MITGRQVVNKFACLNRGALPGFGPIPYQRNRENVHSVRFHHAANFAQSQINVGNVFEGFRSDYQIERRIGIRETGQVFGRDVGRFAAIFRITQTGQFLEERVQAARRIDFRNRKRLNARVAAKLIKASGAGSVFFVDGRDKSFCKMAAAQVGVTTRADHAFALIESRGPLRRKFSFGDQFGPERGTRFERGFLPAGSAARTGRRQSVEPLGDAAAKIFQFHTLRSSN